MVSLLASPRFMAVVIIPSPIGLVKIMASPFFAPELDQILSGCVNPFTTIPNLGSGSSTVCPPTISIPASLALSCAP